MHDNCNGALTTTHASHSTRALHTLVFLTEGRNITTPYHACHATARQMYGQICMPQHLAPSSDCGHILLGAGGATDVHHAFQGFVTGGISWRERNGPNSVGKLTALGDICQPLAPYNLHA